jgi:hypothetical protein
MKNRLEHLFQLTQLRAYLKSRSEEFGTNTREFKTKMAVIDSFVLQTLQEWEQSGSKIEHLTNQNQSDELLSSIRESLTDLAQVVSTLKEVVYSKPQVEIKPAVRKEISISDEAFEQVIAEYDLAPLRQLTIDDAITSNAKWEKLKKTCFVKEIAPCQLTIDDAITSNAHREVTDDLNTPRETISEVVSTPIEEPKQEQNQFEWEALPDLVIVEEPVQTKTGKEILADLKESVRQATSEASVKDAPTIPERKKRGRQTKTV